MAVKKGGLGKGLDALFNENATDTASGTELNIFEIEPNRDQPRKDFDDESISELSESILKHGLLQPIVVRPKPNGRYEIVAGERRWRACRLAGLDSVPVIIKDLDEQKAAEIALVENLQRENLNAYEEALGYKSLMDDFGLTQEAVSQSVGKSRVAVTNALRLLNLPENILAALREGKISAGAARTLLSAKSEAIMKAMFEAALLGASVRTLEQMAKKEEKPIMAKKVKVLSNFEREVALSLKQALHRNVKITSNGKGKGSITIDFYNQEELKDFANRLTEK